MAPEEIIEITRIVVQIGYKHWVKHGTPIKVEDAGYVAVDVLAALGRPGDAVTQMECASDHQQSP